MYFLFCSHHGYQLVLISPFKREAQKIIETFGLSSAAHFRAANRCTQEVFELLLPPWLQGHSLSTPGKCQMNFLGSSHHVLLPLPGTQPLSTAFTAAGSCQAWAGFCCCLWRFGDRYHYQERQQREGEGNNSPKSLVQTAKRTSVSLHGRQGAGEKGTELAQDQKKGNK